MIGFKFLYFACIQHSTVPLLNKFSDTKKQNTPSNDLIFSFRLINLFDFQKPTGQNVKFVFGPSATINRSFTV